MFTCQLKLINKFNDAKYLLDNKHTNVFKDIINHLNVYFINVYIPVKTNWLV